MSRLFPEIDRGGSGFEPGLPCKFLSPIQPVANVRSLEVFPSFIVNLGAVTVEIRRVDLEAFLKRNPSLNTGPSFNPADIVYRLWRDRTPSPLPMSSPPPPAPLFDFSIWKKMAATDPTTTNIFFFIEKHIRRFPSHSCSKGQPNFPFSYLNSLLCICPRSLALEDQIGRITERLTKEAEAQSQVALAIGLNNPSVIEKIVDDFKAYRSPRIVFVGDFEESVKKELLPQIPRLIEQFPKDAPDRTSCILLPQDPSTLLVCKNTGENVYEFSLRHSRPLPDEKKQALVRALEELNLSPQTVKTILCGLSFDWFGFYRPDEKEATIFHQTHRVKGLKIFMDRSGAIVADIARKPLAWGTSKRFKSKYTLHLDGTLIPNGRYTALQSDSESQRVFLTDANHELSVREGLGEVPGLLPFYISGRYYSRKNDTQPKTRFESILCDGAIENLVYDSEGKPLPPDQRKTLCALYAAYDALRALEVIHSKEMVVKDVKPANVLWTVGESQPHGMLCDLGFAISAAAPLSDQGTKEFSPPECIWPKPGQKNDPRIDLFAYGYLLLLLYLPEFRTEIDRLQGGAFGLAGFQRLSEKQYTESLNQLRSRIPQTKLGLLIFDLVNPESRKRPTTTEALDRFTMLLPKLARDPFINLP